MRESLRVSIVVMTRERPRALRRLLASLSNLDVPKAVFEVIVIDDGSATAQPDLSEAFPELRLRYEWIPHQGVSAARNAGLALASGALVAFLADDYAVPSDYLSRGEELFRLYPDAQVITFNVRSAGRSPARHIQQAYCDSVLLENAGVAPDEKGVIRTFQLPASRGAIFKRELFDEVGVFDERLQAGEDGELAQRMAARGIPVYFVPDYYIDHHEEKGFGDFLRQRREYATSYWAVISRSIQHGNRPQWPLQRVVYTVVCRLRSWLASSWRRGWGPFVRFCTVAPGLALFLFRFYHTVHVLERADRRAREGTLTRVRRRLNALTRFAVFRVPVLAAVRVSCVLAATILSRSGRVAAVYARGSYVRGDFQPFLSDVDLAILIRRPAPGHGYATAAALHRDLRAVRWVNPLVRDVWQTFLPEAHWPLLERFGYLFEVDEWRLLRGIAPPGESAPPNRRLLCAAWWNRQHFWTTVAVRQALCGEVSLRALPASLKKAERFAARIRDSLGEDCGGHLNPRYEPSLDLSDAMVALDRSAKLLIDSLGLDAAGETGVPSAAGAAASASASERSILAALSSRFDLERDFAHAIGRDGYLVLIPKTDWSAAQHAEAIGAFRAAYREGGILPCVYSRAAYSLALFREPPRVLLGADAFTRGCCEGPRLLAEQFLYLALHVCGNMWVAPGRPDAARALESHIVHALEMSLFFVTGEAAVPRPSTLGEWLERAQAGDGELAAGLRGAGIRQTADGSDKCDAELFELGLIVAERLAVILELWQPLTESRHAVAAK